MTFLHAQPSTVQSLKVKLSEAKEDSSKIFLLYDLANKLIYTRPDTAVYYAMQADSLSKKLNFIKGHILALNSLGNAHWAKGNLREGLSYFIQSKEAAKESGDADLTAKNIGSMGLIYRAAGNHQAALSYYREALPLFFKLNNWERVAVTYNNLGKCFLEMGQYDSATYYFNLAYPIASENRPNILPILTFNHSDVFFRQKDYVQAEIYVDQSLVAAQQFKDERTIIRGRQMLAEIKLWQGKIEDAQILAIEAAKKAEATQVKELISICYETLSHVYAKKNDFNKAYHFLGLYNSYRDSIQSEDIQERLDFLDFEQQQKEIILLTKEKEIEKKMSRRQQAYIYVLSFLVVIIAVLAFVLYQGRHRKSEANKLLQLKNNEIHRQKEEMSAQADKLQNLNQLKNKLFSIISHDLRSPLNTLSGSLYLVQNELIDHKDFKAFLPELIKNVSFTTTLLDNLLHWAKNQLEGTEINPEKVNLKKLAHLKTELLQNQADHKNIRLINEIQHEIYVFADEIMIQIVLQNLLSNAIKFCRSGDQVTLSWEHQEKYVNICVRDTGMGMDQEKQEKLFNSTSFSTRGTANEKGTGLGLLLCKDFVEKNGGKIWVESTLGQGSIFCFSLELYHQQTDPQPLNDQR
ncbi:tetratricopeptide repeat-containing sensor histidine kinase [Catalinimonas niigatensis]|uniref:tetratricopeptide repeat-containing sensor histidine kinase n=1 Tax=Catalinimonas niigatensis TaxID=1397264 RepID=UPI002666D42A|nr:tetratricopeptide repeat-containing sensor histidine kinase [Catalinimonas niigatensis]WPP50441.1 tetratricopeptide repeat-containing sensor histidine kinase [Catalinimonas niigatensis]